MAETLTAAAAAIGGSAAPAAAGAAGAAGAAAGSSLFGTALQTGLALTSAGLSIASGLRQGQALDTRANIEELNARQELIRGAEETNKIRENLLRTLAAQNAGFGAAGIDVGSGTPVDVAEETQAQADRELDISRGNTALRAGVRNISAASLRSDASGARVGGFGQAGFSLLNFANARARIG